jgi:tRNA A37 threonylcarbamoyladenosine dehydratase
MYLERKLSWLTSDPLARQIRAKLRSSYLTKCAHTGRVMYDNLYSEQHRQHEVRRTQQLGNSRLEAMQK